MATVIVSDVRTLDQPGQSFTLENNSSLTVTRSGVIGSLTGATAVAGGTSLDIWVEGTITAPNALAIALRGNSSIYVGSQGSISGLTGIRQSDADSPVAIINDGDINARQAAIELYGAGSHLRNTGRINSAYNSAILMLGTSSAIDNAGTISGLDNVVVLYGSTADDAAELTNRGTITAVATTAVAIGSGAVLTRITNAGTISGRYSDTAGVIQGGGAREIVLNTGTIQGNVLLRAGDDTFNSALGTIQGFIDGGEGNDVLVGSRYDDVIFGGTESDIVNGGAGDDRLDGGGGTDKVSYKGAAAAVTVDLSQAAAQDTGGGGTDTLSGFENVLGSSFGDTLIGSTGINALTGDAGNDLLDGGAGSDTLSGGAGRDTFRFTATLGASNIDTITSFVAADDTIALGRTAFAGLTAGALASGAFRTGSTALDADDRILYNAATGALSFDRDGSGTAYAAQQFARIGTNLTLTSGDFVVV